jgi:hypothetical protein
LGKLRDAKRVYEKTTAGRTRDASLPKIAKEADAVAQELIEAEEIMADTNSDADIVVNRERFLRWQRLAIDQLVSP